MALKLLILLALLRCTLSKNNHQYSCTQESTLLLQKDHAYRFAIGLLDRAAQNEEAHFVLSPVSTWLELNALADGATGSTLKEIYKVTRHHQRRCFRLMLAGLLKQINRGLKYEFVRKSVMVVDKFSGMRKKFARDVKKVYGIEVMYENFGDPDASADKVNDFVETGTNYVIPDAVNSEDFKNSVMLLSDNVYFRTAWNYSFSKAHTKTERFSSFVGVDLGKVNMMHQLNYFNYAELPQINAKVLELPCVSNVSMLFFLPTKDVWLGDMFYNLQQTTLNSIFIKFKNQGLKLVNVKIPRFQITTDIENLAELIDDMGVRKVFNPKRAELTRISKFTMYASLMRQISDIKVIEEGVRATEIVQALVDETNNKTEHFVANKPFAFIIVDKETQFILFAGAYSVPSEI